MESLTLAKALAREVTTAQENINKYLLPVVRDYIEFMDEISPNYHDNADRKADTFDCIDNETFHFTGEEFYEYGEYHKPSVSLPFSFVEDSEAYKTKARADKAEQDARQAAKRAAAKAEQIARLEAQLAKARAEV